MQIGFSRWRTLGHAAVLSIPVVLLTYVATGVPWKTVGFVLAGAGIAVWAWTFRPAPGTRIADWGKDAVTPHQARQVCLGMAMFMLSMPLILLGAVEMTNAPWDAFAVLAVFTTMLMYGVVTSLVLRARLSEREVDPGAYPDDQTANQPEWDRGDRHETLLSGLAVGMSLLWMLVSETMAEGRVRTVAGAVLLVLTVAFAIAHLVVRARNRAAARSDGA